MEQETMLVRNCSPGASLLQRCEQHGQDLQLTGGTLITLFVCSPQENQVQCLLCLKPLSSQILLQNSTLGNTVDETEGLIKRHEAFEKLLSSQEDKVCSNSVYLSLCVIDLSRHITLTFR